MAKTIMEEALAKQKRAQTMAQKIIEHLDPEHILGFSSLKALLEGFLAEIETLRK